MPPGTRRIVAIDFDASIGQRLRTAFHEPEYDFHWFSDGREALARLHEIRPHVILCDLMLPGLDGRGVLEAVRQSPALRNIPFLVLSGVRSEATIRATLEAGAQAFLVKPCPVAQLKQTIDRILEEAAQPPEADPGEAPRRHVEALRLIPTGNSPGAEADDATDSDRPAAGAEAPIVCEGRVSTLELDGKSFQVQTIAEGEPQEMAITTTVMNEGKELRRAQSRLACEDAKTLKELLDAQHARALDAVRQLQAQGRLSGPLSQRPSQKAAEAQDASATLVAAPLAAAADNPPAPAESPKAEEPRPGPRPASEPAPSSGRGNIDVPRKTPRARSQSRKQSPPATLAPGTVVMKPLEMKPPEEKEPAPSEPEILPPRPQPAPAPIALDTVLLETSEDTAPSILEDEILTDETWSETRRGRLWHYLPRVAAALIGVGVLAILLEGPSDDTEPPKSAAAVSPEPPSPSEPSPGRVTNSPAARASAAARVIASPAAVPRATPKAMPAATRPTVAPRAAPTAGPTVAPKAAPTAATKAAPTAAPTSPPSALPASAKRSAPASAEPAAVPGSAADRSDQMLRGRLQWAQALYDRGRYDEARTALKEIFKLAPSDAQARALAAQLERSAAGMPPSAGADSAPEADHQEVLALLGRYETALEQGDVTSLKAIWPHVDPQEISERWKSLRSWRMVLRLIDLEVTGDEAVALCVSYDNMLTVEGEKIENSSRVSFHLRRDNGSWIIAAVK